MPWTPSSSTLGTHAEMASFNYTIQYYEESGGGVDLITGLPIPVVQTYYPVKITPNEVNPASIVFAYGVSANVSGYFQRAFNDTLLVMNKDMTYTTVTTMESPVGDVFGKIDKNKLSEVVSYRPDMTRSKTFTYTATAYTDTTYVTQKATKTYTILLQDKNWTTGKLALQSMVAYTEAN